MRIIIALFLVTVLSSCSLFTAAKPYLRVIRDVSHALCCAEEGKLGSDGMSVEEYCEKEEVIKPYADAVLAAGKMASGRVAASRAR